MASEIEIMNILRYLSTDLVRTPQPKIKAASLSQTLPTFRLSGIIRRTQTLLPTT